jgi:multiple sugar transport system substrate-binding protein
MASRSLGQGSLDAADVRERRGASGGMHITRRRAVAGAAAGTGLVATAAMAACNIGPAAPSSADKAPVELTYMNSSTSTPGDPRALNGAKINKLYTDRHPNVTITDNSAGTQNSDEFFAKILALYSAGTPPDVFQLQANRFADYWPKGLLLDLTSYAAKDPKGAGKDDTYPVIWNQTEQQGKLPGLAMAPSTAIHIFSVDAYRQLGMRTPAEASESGTWTWDLYKETATRQLNRTPGGNYRVAHRGMGTDDLAMQTWANGGETLNKDGTRLMYDSPAALEAMDYIYDFVARRKLTFQPDDLSIMGAPAGVNDPNILWAFPNGKLTNAIQGSTFISNLRQPVLDTKLNWGIAPVPAGKKSRFTRVESQFMVIAAPTKHADTSWSFLAHLGSAESDALRVDELMFEPVRKSNARRYTDLKLPGLPPGMKYVVDSRQFAGPWVPRIPEWTQVARIISTHFDAAMKDQISTKDAMQKMTVEANAILSARR